MPKGDQDHRRVAMAMAVLPCRSGKRLDFSLGQVLAGAQLTVLRPPRHHCSFFDGWRDQLQVRIAH